jgi:MFS family permease
MKVFRVTRVVLVMLCIMYFITYLDRVNVSTAAAGFSQDFHLNKTQIGLVFSAFAYPYLVFQIIGGWVSDRFGARKTLLICGMLWAVATVLTGMALGLLSLLMARLLLGFGEGATFPAATRAMSRWVPRERRGFAQGLTHACARIGNAVAPAAVVYIMATHGWRVSFYVCGAVSLVWSRCGGARSPKTRKTTLELPGPSSTRYRRRKHQPRAAPFTSLGASCSSGWPRSPWSTSVMAGRCGCG